MPAPKIPSTSAVTTVTARTARVICSSRVAIAKSRTPSRPMTTTSSGIRRLINDGNGRIVHPARPARIQEGRQSGAAGRGRARTRDRQAVRHRRHVLRLDQQGGARDPGHRHEPPGRPSNSGEGGEDPDRYSPLPNGDQQVLRHQAGGHRPFRRDHRVPGQRRTNCRSRWPRAPSPAKAGSCPATR